MKAKLSSIRPIVRYQITDDEGVMVAEYEIEHNAVYAADWISRGAEAVGIDGAIAQLQAKLDAGVVPDRDFLK